MEEQIIEQNNEQELEELKKLKFEKQDLVSSINVLGTILSICCFLAMFWFLGLTFSNSKTEGLSIYLGLIGTPLIFLVILPLSIVLFIIRKVKTNRLIEVNKSIEKYKYLQ